MNRRHPTLWQKYSFVRPLLLLFSFLAIYFWFFGGSSATKNEIYLGKDSTYELIADREVGEMPEKIQGDVVKIVDLGKPRYLAIIPGFGPNNQFLGLKDMMYISKLTGRILARPDFFTHAIDKLNSIRPYEKTLDTQSLDEYVPTVSLQEYANACQRSIDVIIWGRAVGSWRRVVNLWLTHANMTAAAENLEKRDLFFPTVNDVMRYFQKFQDKQCVAFAFPFRNVAETPERKSISKYLKRAPWIAEVGKAAYQEMGVKKLLAIHWRWGEDSCGWYDSPPPNENYDFCWGTAIFHFTKLNHVFAALKTVIEEKQVSTVYLAVSMMYHDKVVMQKLKDFMKDLKVDLFVGSESLKVLKNITDNYYLSLVEQEICDRATTFIWSSDSTWSDFIVDHNVAAAGSLETISFSNLLSRFNLPFTTWNRERDPFWGKRPPKPKVN